LLSTKWSSIARKLPSPIYKIAAQAWIDYKFPRHIFIETTANCNLSCSYCPREKRKEDMDFRLFTQIVDECSLHGARSFSLHLFGEPLLYNHILDAIEYIKRKNRFHTVLLTTNGTLLNGYVDELVKLGVDKIIWSYRANKFNTRTKEVLKERGKIRLLIEETPNEEFDYWSKFPDVEIKHLHNYGGNIDITKWGLKDNTSTSGRWPCYHLWLAPAIRWNGEITMCCNVPKSGTEVLGIYGTDSLEAIWRGDKIKQLREGHMRGEYKGACVGCNSYQAYPNIFFQSKCQSV